MRRVVRPRRPLFPPVPGWAELVRRYSLEPHIKFWGKFDQPSGNLIDHSGLGNHLGPNGNPLAQQFDFMGRKSSVLFDGAADYYSITDAAQTGLDLNGAELGGANLGFEVGDFTGWIEEEAGGSTMDINAVAPIAGTKDAKMTVDAVPSNVGIYRHFGGLTGGRQYTVQFKYKDDVATNTIKYYIKDSNNIFLQADGTWDAVQHWFSLAGSIAVALAVKPFTLLPDATGATVYIRNNAGTSCEHWLDDFSLTECFDAVILAVAKPGIDVTTNRPLICKRTDPNYKYALFINNTDGKIAWQIGDDTNECAVLSGNAHNDNDWHLFEAKLDRDSVTGQNIFVDGQSDLAVKGDPTAVGDLDNTANFECAYVSGTYFLGSIAEVMILTGSPLSKLLLSDQFALDAYELTGLRLFQ